MKRIFYPLAYNNVPIAYAYRECWLQRLLGLCRGKQCNFKKNFEYSQIKAWLELRASEASLEATHLFWRSHTGWRNLLRVSHNQTQIWWRAGFLRRRLERAQSSRSTSPQADRSRPRRPVPQHSRTWKGQRGKVFFLKFWVSFGNSVLAQFRRT